jgi:lysyl-tRNA synthetase class 2
MSEDRTIREIRIEKLEAMRKLGHDPFQNERFETTRSAQQMVDRFEGLEGESVKFAGRVVSYRLMGKAGFAHVSDGDGKIQVYFRKDDLTETEWELYNLLDIGDHVGVHGELFRTKTGEKSIHARSLMVLSKALEPLPIGKEKDGQIFSGLSDPELRFRHRHLDLIANPDVRKKLLDRSRIVSSVRRYFDQSGYLEVETPLLQREAGGAAARPFLTHYNAYDMDVKLRISLELYLKRIICGDVPRVYEIGRVFRNEGVSNRHSPEFTMLEFYEAYANLEDMMVRVEEVFRHVAMEVYGSPVVRIELEEGDIQDEDSSADPLTPDPSLQGAAHGNSSADPHPLTPPPLTPSSLQGEGSLSLDFSQPWRRVSLLGEIERHTGMTAADLTDIATAKAALKTLNVVNPVTGKRIDPDEEDNLGGLIEKLLEVFVEPTLQEPTFVVGYPIETSPLAKKDPQNPGMTRRFEGYIRGREVCNAFSEINDPIDQRERFEDQLRQAEAGNEESHPMDEEFLYALECGMPPTGGCGIGIDRMVMMLTGADTIRQVLLFPTMRPAKKVEEE